MRIHGLCKILRKMDILQEVLSFAHKRSLSKYSEIDHEEDFFETGEAPDIHREWGVLGVVGGKFCCGGGLDGMIFEFQSKLFQDFRSWLLRGHPVPLWGLRSPPSLCFSLPLISQNAPETRNQIPQLLPGEGDRPLPQAGMYSSRNGNIPREQLSPPPPLHALLAWIPPSCSLFSLYLVVFQGGAAEGGLGSVSVAPKWVTKLPW